MLEIVDSSTSLALGGYRCTEGWDRNVTVRNSCAGNRVSTEGETQREREREFRRVSRGQSRLKAGCKVNTRAVSVVRLTDRCCEVSICQRRSRKFERSELSETNRCRDTPSVSRLGGPVMRHEALPRVCF